MRRRLSILVFLLATSLFARASAQAQGAPRFEDEELAALAAGLAKYTLAREGALGLEEARAAITASLDELRRKHEGEDPLRSPADLGRAWFLSQPKRDAKVAKGKVASESFPSASFPGAGLELAYRLPKDVARDATYPLILAIPDADEAPADHLRAQWTLRELLDGAILVSPRMPADRAEWDRVMVNGRPGGLCHVLTALRFATERFPVDVDRIYVAGRGKGVPAALAAGNATPQRFAGILGLAGDAGDLGPENFSNLPTYFAGAGAKASAFQAAARAAGFDNCLVQPTGKEQDLWHWIQEHPRQAYPASVTVVPGDPFPTRAYWLRIAPCASDARVSATIERDTNTIRITAQGASQATLYLNDALIDLDRPVRVIANELERSAALAPSLSSALDMLFDGTSDASSAYVTQELVDLRAEARAPASVASSGADAEYEQRYGEAQGDAARLWELYEWCLATQREARGEAVLKRIVRLDPEHALARERLGHRRSAEQWFSSQEALERFQRSQDPEAARAKGHVQHDGIWMHPSEVALAGKGLVKDHETGQWLSVADRRRIAEGWVRQDLEWIAPEEAARADEGLWRIDGEWSSLEAANRRHASVESMWCIPSSELVLYSTAERATSLRAMHEMRRALDDLRRVFGAEPLLPLRVAVLRDEEQYDRFAFGDPDGRRPPAHTGRLHVIHSGFFAESWFARVEGKLEFRGMGVCYWDPAVPNGDLYGVHSARLALGFSYVDALDPSPNAVRKALARGPQSEYSTTYQSEKQLPAWLRTGGAVYAERYFHDATVGPDGDAWWARKWSIDNLKSRGGLRPLEEVFAFALDPENRDDGLELYLEAGLLVAFLVDGACDPLIEAHGKLKQALVSGRLHANHVAAIQDALLAHQAELLAFAGLP